MCVLTFEETLYRGTSLIRNSNSPHDHRMALGIVPLLSPRRKRFHVSEVPLYTQQTSSRHTKGTARRFWVEEKFCTISRAEGMDPRGAWD